VKKQVKIPLTAVLAGVLVLVLAAAYMLLIRPKGNEASNLDSEIASLQAEASLASDQNAAAAQPKVKINVADLFRVAKALPDGSDMAEIMVELVATADASGVKFESIQPSDAVAFTGYSAVPINLTVQGNYYDLIDFLYRLRGLVTVKEGVLDATGRLYSIDSIDIHQAPGEEFPKIEAALTISAYAYGAAPAPTGTPGAPASTAPGATESGSTDTTQTSTGTTTGGTTTTSGSDGAQAAGGTN
jgi:Tfp pilus assembly protein PilO